MRKILAVCIIMFFLSTLALVALAWHALETRREEAKRDADLDLRLEDLIRKYGKQEAEAKPFECNPDTTPWTVGGWNVGRKQEICL